MIRLVGSARTDVGQLRTINQDEALTSVSVYAVADGMGGHLGGEVASEIALRTVAGWTSLRSESDLADAARAANEAVSKEGARDANLRGMGTTLTCLALLAESEGGEPTIGIVNVGDSRCYRLRNGDLELVTEDHSLVQSLITDGRITEAEAVHHPRRNILTRALGIEQFVEVDTFREPAVVDDRYLLCSDGLHGELSDDEISRVLGGEADTDGAARRLIELANGSGGRDNITCVVVDVVDDTPETAERADSGGTVLGLSGGTATATLARSDSAERVDLAAANPDQTTTIGQIPVASTLVGEREVGRPKRFTWRVLAFVTSVLLVLGTAFAVVGWFGTKTFFVGENDGKVAIYQGRPGGLLWIEPNVVDTLDLETTELREVDSDRLREPVLLDTRAEAEALVDDWRESISGSSDAPDASGGGDSPGTDGSDSTDG